MKWTTTSLENIGTEGAITNDEVDNMADDLFDVLGLSLFASGEKWCLLNSDPCIPLPSCDDDIVDDHCKHESEEEDEVE